MPPQLRSNRNQACLGAGIRYKYSQDVCLYLTDAPGFVDEDETKGALSSKVSFVWGIMKFIGSESGRSALAVNASRSTGAVFSNKSLSSIDPNPSVKIFSPLEVSTQDAETSKPGAQSGTGLLRDWTPVQAETRTVIQSEILTRLIHSLNLPMDNLSSALISFVRYFALPLDPALLIKLRREALSLKIPVESAALAVAAAADKGVELTSSAVSEYGAAIDPDARREQSGTDSPWGGTDRDHPGKTPDAEGLRKIGDILEETNPLLSILNGLPGRNGDRWRVYPFEVSAGEKRFRVSVRVKAGQDKAGVRLAVDIAGGDRRWLFVMNQPSVLEQGKNAENRPFPGSGPSPECGIPSEVLVSLWPPPGRRERAALEREIRKVLGPAVNWVILRDCESFFADSQNKALPSINKEV
jgi:hypothetical protein